jgi:hypothetical protein
MKHELAAKRKLKAGGNNPLIGRLPPAKIL